MLEGQHLATWEAALWRGGGQAVDLSRLGEHCISFIISPAEDTLPRQGSFHQGTNPLSSWAQAGQLAEH